jgi:hypothetical protein
MVLTQDSTRTSATSNQGARIALFFLNVKLGSRSVFDTNGVLSNEFCGSGPERHWFCPFRISAADAEARNMPVKVMMGRQAQTEQA